MKITVYSPRDANTLTHEQEVETISEIWIEHNATWFGRGGFRKFLKRCYVLVEGNTYQIPHRQFVLLKKELKVKLLDSHYLSQFKKTRRGYVERKAIDRRYGVVYET